MDEHVKHIESWRGFKVGNKAVLLKEPTSRPFVSQIEDIVKRCGDVYIKFKGDYQNKNHYAGCGIDRGYIMVESPDKHFYGDELNIMTLEPDENEIRCIEMGWLPKETFVQRVERRRSKYADHERSRARGIGIQQAYSYHSMHWSSY